MSTEQQANLEVSSLLAELDAEFGKKPKQKFPPAPHKALNQAFHAANPKIAGARGQLDRMAFDNYYDWEMHKQRLLDIERAQEEGVPELQWLPEARVTYVVHQTCSTCKNCVSFTGHEYIRFRGRRRKYRTLEGEVRETAPTMLKPVGKVDGNLLAFGFPGGDPIPDEVEEMNETVSRCPGCIQVERMALDLWIQATQPKPQGELIIDIPLSPEGL